MPLKFPGRGYGKNKSSINFIFMSKFNKLSRAEMKSVLGGLVYVGGGDVSCDDDVQMTQHARQMTIAKVLTQIQLNVQIPRIKFAGLESYNCI